MGLDVYAKVMVGVRLLDHAEFGARVVEQTRYDEKTGKPYKQSVRADILKLWNGNEYECTYSYDTATGLPSIFDLDIGQGLSVEYCNNGSYPSKDSIVGRTVGAVLSMRGGSLSMTMPDIDEDSVRRVRKALIGVGIFERPSTHIVMVISS